MTNNKQATPLLDGYFAWLDGLCASLLTIQQSQCPEAFQGRGVVVPESQVTLALSGQVPLEPQPGFSHELGRLEAEIPSSKEPLGRLFQRLRGNSLERLAVVLALAPELNRKYERVFAYLQDDASARQATLGLLADLWSLTAPAEEFVLFSLCDEGSLLNRCVLNPGPTGLSRPLVLRQSALHYLTGTAHLPELLSHTAQLLPAGEVPRLLTNREPAEEALSFACLCLSGKLPGTGLLQLYGSEGSGRRFLLEYVACSLRRPLLLVDCRCLSELQPQDRRQAAQSALSWAYLHEALPVMHHFDFQNVSEPDRLHLARELLDTFRDVVPLLAICAEKPMKPGPEAGFRLLQLTIPNPTIGQQRLYWEDFSQKVSLPLEKGLDSLYLSSIYTMTPGKIQRALSLAETVSLARNCDRIGWDAVAQGVRLLYGPRLAELTEPLHPSFTWEDLEVDHQAMEKLQRLCSRIRHRWKVNEEWGFDRRLPYGKGVSVCLYGPPGTGKTMTAQVLAREFGLDAYRVDMSRIMDKYIGETEKKLAELFDAARDTNAILFFDEADALFAKRTDVDDSKDRYANVETAYLLQRMETHNGISILATNAVQNFDEAFKRRISYMIPLSLPDVETRNRLWRKVFPPEAPLAGINFDFFAKRFELSGSSIKNVALTAAYLAASSSGVIGREELTDAIREEYRKTGRVLMEHELI